jgi:molybdenum cofactor cytidylyltransferase
MKSFQDSEKKHLLITGSKKSGKTTIRNEIVRDQNLFGGIETFAIRDEHIIPKQIILRDIKYPKISGMIAKRNEAGNSLIPIPETFEELGSDILNRYNSSEVETMIIDEIGFLERNCPTYQKELMYSLENKKVIATVRKELNAFTRKLIQHPDIYLIDMDKIRSL